MTDEELMLRALDLSKQARTLSPPNPWVGCVLVKDHVIVGEGFTQPAGASHAEIVALDQAKEKAHGATAYVTLEPCCHHGKTPPCTEALIRAQIKKIFIALQDPDPKVCGKGISQLKEAGIEVSLGLCESQAAAVLKPYIFQRKTKRPFVLAKAACSLDGRIAAHDGSSQWLSSEKARLDAQTFRAESQAILIGANTAAKDLPKLTLRNQSNKQPIRIVVDSSGSLPAKGPLFDTSLAPTLILTTADATDKTLAEWLQHNVKVERLPKSENGVDLIEALKFLESLGIIQLLCEGGGRLLSSLLKQNLINQLTVYLSPLVLGDQGLPLFANFPIPSLKDAPQLTLMDTVNFDGTVRLDYILEPQES